MNKISKKVKTLIVFVVLVAVAWFLVVQPRLIFKGYEDTMDAAAKRYFDLNSSELPTGERVKTIPLQTLYDRGMLENDFYIPLSKKTCSNTNSWAKVRKENGVYKYYVYLECGRYKSNVDHEGPVITLNGDSTITLGRGSKYKELGVKSVTDNTDGNMKTSDVVIKAKVNGSRAGTYKVEYIAFDSLSNKTTVTRTVKVVRKLSTEVKSFLDGKSNYTGDPINNYVRLSNMLFRIYGVDENDNVILVSNSDVANINFSKIDKWLEYYYNNLNDATKKMIVEKKYCNMKLDEKEVSTTKKCGSYTEKKKVYIPSAIDVMNASDEIGYNFMKNHTMSWVSNTKNDKEAYLTRSVFYGDYSENDFMAYSVTDNYGVRPMFTIDGNLLIRSGQGTIGNPYLLGDNKPARGGTPLNERECGESLKIDGNVFRIIGVESDGTTKVISDGALGEEVVVEANPGSKKIVYDPKDKNSVAYAILNKATDYLDTSLFVKHKVEVPIYKNKIIYGEEVKTKNYNLILAAPNMYEMFSAQSSDIEGQSSYWLINSSQANRRGAAIQNVGIPMNEEITESARFGLRVTGYLKKSVVIVDGKGTQFDPYIIK